MNNIFQHTEDEKRLFKKKYTYIICKGTSVWHRQVADNFRVTGTPSEMAKN